MTLDTGMMTAVLIALIFTGVAGFAITKAFDDWRATVSSKKIFCETQKTKELKQ